jgi:hypothetical protein
MNIGHGLPTYKELEQQRNDLVDINDRLHAELAAAKEDRDRWFTYHNTWKQRAEAAEASLTAAGIDYASLLNDFHKIEAENAALRKVVDAAREISTAYHLDGDGKMPTFGRPSIKEKRDKLLGALRALEN